MKKQSANTIRDLWINFWKSKHHAVLPSASLIPKNDPSLLWINSGVATLKDYFAGQKIPPNPRMTNAQKSLRTSDIDKVGITARHHTLFEMLGNFSIGDYFKDEALAWAWEFLIDVLKLKQANIYITYYEADHATYNKWKALGIADNHLIKGNKATNFWDIGAGPCGPDTEIFYDRGPKYDPQGQGIALLVQDIENDRYVEIWNIVFSQFNNDGAGNYVELKHKNIDTGAGLERIASILQNAPTNFDTDLFLPIIKGIEELVDHKYIINNYFIKKLEQTKINKHFRVIADHMRAITQAINDGVQPTNTQRGYIIRRLIRRAYRSGLQLGVTTLAFLYKLVPVVHNTLPLYPLDIEHVQVVIKQEEVSFSKTIQQGEALLLQSIQGNKRFDIAIAFKLFATYGFPIELTQELLAEHGIALDMHELEALKDKHAQVSKSKQVRGMPSQIQVIQTIQKNMSTFIGYDCLESHAQVLFQGKENQKYYVLLDKTPFYATKGGQIHDKGVINDVEVVDVFKDAYNNNWHVLPTPLIGLQVVAQVDANMRLAKARNHSGTHILGHALRLAISASIIQLGSENNAKRLRFDFPLDHKLSLQEIDNVEKVANKLIAQALPRSYIIDTFKNGLKMGALAIDNEMEGDPQQLSRIVKFGDSIEFCGGTHVANTALIEKIKITKVESKGAGTYRIEAITSQAIIADFELNQKQVITQLINHFIVKNQKLNPTYTLEFTKPTLKQLRALLAQAQATHKKLSKQVPTQTINFDLKFINYKGMSAFIKLDILPQDVKFLALKLRVMHRDKLFILGAQTNQLLIAIASHKYNCQVLFADLIAEFKGQGGGNKDFAMGTLEAFHI